MGHVVLAPALLVQPVGWLWGWTGTNKTGPGECNTLVQLQSLSPQTRALPAPRAGGATGLQLGFCLQGQGSMGQRGGQAWISSTLCFPP